MKRPFFFRRNTGRKRRVIGWTMVLLATLVAGVWAASRWWGARYSWRNAYVDVRCGWFALSFVSYDMRQLDLYCEPELLPTTILWFPWHREIIGSDVYTESTTSYEFGVFNLSKSSKASSRTFQIVLWPVPLLLLAGGVPMIRSGLIARRRSRDGLCKACGYDRRSLAAEAKCPECGA